MILNKYLRKSILLTLFLTFIQYFISCASSVTTANFKETQGTVKPGNLIGPFFGIVKDHQTNEAISFAKIHCYFIFKRDGKIKTKIINTLSNIDGKYKIRQFKSFDFWKPDYILNNLKCIVLHKGYVPYISNRYNFTQYNNEIKLSPKKSTFKSYRFLMPYLGLTDLYEYFAGDFYAASEELSNISNSYLNSAGLILPEQAMKILNITTTPLLKNTTSTYDESGFTLYFDNHSMVSWYVKSALTSQIKTAFKLLSSQLKISSKPIKTLDGINIYLSQTPQSFTGVIPDYVNGLLFIITCSGQDCNKNNTIQLIELAYEQKNTLVFTGGK